MACVSKTPVKSAGRGLTAAGVLAGGVFNIFGDCFFVFTCGMGIFGAGRGGRIREALRLALYTTAFFALFRTVLSLACPNLHVRVFMSPTLAILAIAPAIIRTYALFCLLSFNIFSTYSFQSILQPGAAFAVSVARGLVISGGLILALPALAGPDALWPARQPSGIEGNRISVDHKSISSTPGSIEPGVCFIR